MRRIRLGTTSMRHAKLDGKEVPAATIAPRLEEACTLVEEARQQACDLLCLPELFADPTQGTEEARFAEPLGGPVTGWLSATARSSGMALAATVCLRRGDRLTNTGVVYARDGRLAGSYDKVHLPPGEEKMVSYGMDFPVFDVEGITVGMQICYDLGFPEGCRILAIKGAELILWPNMWGGMPEATTDVIMRARAVENQVCLVSAGYFLDEGPSFRQAKIHGRNCIVDPDGVVLAEVGLRAGVAVATVDFDAPATEFVHKHGSRFACRRPDTYGPLVT